MHGYEEVTAQKSVQQVARYYECLNGTVLRGFQADLWTSSDCQVDEDLVQEAKN